MKKLSIAIIFCLIAAALIVLAAPPTPCTFWSWLGNSKLDGNSLPIGTVIKAYDPQNVLCGQYTVDTTGQFSFDCIGDDPDTAGTDEGANSGDTIKFYINDILAAVTGGSAVWQSGYLEVNIEATTVTPCTSDDNCTSLDTACADGVCNASGKCVQEFKLAATLCRAAGGVCDVAETCTGSSASCPSDSKSTAECRAATGDCDVAESCDGTNNDCPADGVQPITHECRASAGVCDTADKCDGAAKTCPADAKSTAECRAASGICDKAEVCDGADNNCPPDQFQLNNYQCRAAANDCDVAETCTGSSASCPSDAKSPAGTQCGSARDCPADACSGFFVEFYPTDGHDTCDGSGNCNVYSCTKEDSYCSDNNAGDGINGLTCSAPCDQNSDCSDSTCSTTYNDYCNGKKLVEYDADKVQDSTTVTDSCGNTCEDDCTCTNCVTDCSAPSTSTYCVKNVCAAECAVDADCDDSDASTYDTCLNTCICTHTTESCNNLQDDDHDGLTDCADPDCAGGLGPNGKVCCQVSADCDNAQYCDGAELCSNHECGGGVAIDCSANNIAGIATCTNNPDNLPFTWDSRAAFISACDEAGDTCTAGDATITHARDKAKCGAQCEQDTDCACQADVCIISDNDGLIDDWADYAAHSTCQADGTCTACTPTITKHDAQCKTTMKIPINKGVSLFSLPLVPEVAKTFNNIQSGCSFTINVTKGIAYWDPNTDAYVYINGDAALFPGQGYFTTQQNDCDFTMDGYKFTTRYVGYLGTSNILLGTGNFKGWNMIGAPSDKVNNFDTVEGNCNVVSGPWGFDATSYSYTRTQILEPGKGYYIKTTNDCNLG